jgi:ketosteroid isomerase-like protein
MSRENVEVVQRVAEALSRRDYEAAAMDLDANVEWHNTAAFPGPRRYSGPEGVRAFLNDQTETFDLQGLEIERVAEASDKVVLVVHTWGQGKASAVPVDARFAMIFALRDAKVIRIEVRGHWAEVLEAMGLRE